MFEHFGYFLEFRSQNSLTSEFLSRSDEAMPVFIK